MSIPFVLPINAHDFCILMEEIWEGKLYDDYYDAWADAIKVALLCARELSAVTNANNEGGYLFEFSDGSRANIGIGWIELLDPNGNPVPSTVY